MPTFTERLMAQMSGANSLAQPPPTQKRSPTTVFTTRFDERAWKDVRAMPKVDRLVNDLDMGDAHRGGTRTTFDRAPELAHDVWSLLYKVSPQILDKEQVERESYPVRSIVEEMSTMSDLRDLQEHTAGDSLMAAAALEAMAGALREIVGRIPPPPPPPQDKDKDDEGDEGDEDDEGESEGEGGGGEPEWDPEAEAEWQAQYDQALAEAGLPLIAYQALEDAKEEVEGVDAVIEAFGLDRGEWRNMDPDERLKLLARLRNEKFRHLADLLGPMKRFHMGLRASRIVDVPQEIHDVETGNNLSRILPSQFALLRVPETRYEFARRYVNRQLLQFKMRGEENAGRGPIVACVDKSGSMSVGGRMDWALGVLECLRQAAGEDEREFSILFFGNNDDRTRFEFPQGKATIDEILNYLSVAADGGTQFDGVLTEALAKASDTFDATGTSRADIVFITDGQAALPPEWIEKFNAEKARVGVRVFSVYIGGASDMYRQSPPTSLLGQISDFVIPVNELRPEAARTIFERI